MLVHGSTADRATDFNNGVAAAMSIVDLEALQRLITAPVGLFLCGIHAGEILPGGRMFPAARTSAGVGIPGTGVVTILSTYRLTRPRAGDGWP